MLVDSNAKTTLGWRRQSKPRRRFIKFPSCFILFRLVNLFDCFIRLSVILPVCASVCPSCSRTSASSALALPSSCSLPPFRPSSLCSKHFFQRNRAPNGFCPTHGDVAKNAVSTLSRCVYLFVFLIEFGSFVSMFIDLTVHQFVFPFFFFAYDGSPALFVCCWFVLNVCRPMHS